MELLIIQTGGTIDKQYPSKQGAYAFEFGDSAIPSILDKAKTQFTYRLVNPFSKDSQDITTQDRQVLREIINKAPETHILISHGTDTLLETAEYLFPTNDKVIVLFGAFLPAAMKDSDADFQLGFALGSMFHAEPNVYIAMNGQLIKANNCIREPKTGSFTKKQKS
jgi:L-asparaginase